MKKIYILLTACMLLGTSCNDMNDFDQGTLKGKVLDATTEQGLADVDIILEPVLAANGNVTSKPDGSFMLSRIVAGTYKINVRKNGASILNNVEDEITIQDGSVIEKEYKLIPRVSVYDFSVDYDKSNPTKFTVNFKAKGNEGNKLNYFAVMWDKYPNYVFSQLPNNQKKAIKKQSAEEVLISQEITGLNLEKNTTYYIRVGVTHITQGGDYNHSDVIAIKFE